MLLTGPVSSLSPIQLPPAQVAASQPIVPVPFQLPGDDSPLTAVVLPPGDPSQDGVLEPGGGIDIYRISVGSASEKLWLELTWDSLPQGASGHLSVFDQTGNLLVDPSTVAGSNSSIVAICGPGLTPGTVLYVGVQMSEPAGAGGAPLPGASYLLQIVTEITPDSSAAYSPPTASVTITTTGNESGTPGGAQGPRASTGAGSPGSGPSSMTPGGGSGPGPSPSRVATAGAAAVGTEGLGSIERATPSLITPIDVGPLPASQYEAAGGIFRVDGSIARVDRVEETRVEMSLVRIASPGRQESSEDVWVSDQDPNTLPVDTRPDSPQDVIIRVGSPSPERSEDPGGEMPWLVSAILPPIDGRDRAATLAASMPPADAADDREKVESWAGTGGAIALALSGSAVLNAALYAPNIAAALHRAVPRPGRRRR